MTVAPHSGIVDFGTFTPPTSGADGIQGEVPKPLAGQLTYVLTANGWAPNPGASGPNNTITDLTGLTGPIQTPTYIDLSTSATVTAAVGRMWWNGGTTLNLGMTANVTQAVGESQFMYIKATSAITKGQLVMFTGSVGSSGVLTGSPSTGVTDGSYLMGIAAEDIALNAFGLIQTFGVVRGFNTSGSSVGETWADGDVLFYNPSYVGGLTKTQPTAPTPKVQVAAVISATSGNSGSIFVRLNDYPMLNEIKDVQITSPANNDVLTYNSALGYWKNAASSGGITRGQVEQLRLGAFT